MPRGPKRFGGVALLIAALACAWDSSRVTALQSSAGEPDLSTISKSNREMIESACRRDRAAYSDCVRRQLAALQAAPGAPDLRAIAAGDQQMIESACSGDRYLNGPAAYYNCLQRQLAALQTSQGGPDLSATSRADQEMIESACGSDRYLHGPAAYYDCVRRQLAALHDSPGTPDLKAISSADQRKIASACGKERSHGPAAYSNCVRQKLAPSLAGGSSSSVNEPVKSISSLPKKARQASHAAPKAREDTKRRHSKRNSGDVVTPDPAGSSAARRVSPEADSATQPVPSPSSPGKLTAGLVVLLVAAGAAGVLFKRTNKKTKTKCIRCKKSIDAASTYCPACYAIVAEAATRAAELEAMAEEERRARLPQPNARSGNGAFDPYAVLRINRNASRDEIRAAYRREIVHYHPDKVAHLAEEFQEVAKTKAQEINRAYAVLAQTH